MEAVAGAGPILPPTRLPCVVHLVRRGNPLELFERFLGSYRRHPAGTEHRLVILCKGFASRAELAPTLERLDGLESELLEVSDEGFDLSAYRAAAFALDCEWLCFLNSSSEVITDGWLEKLRSALAPGVGIAGATGSWNSASSLVRYHLRLPSVYAQVFPDHDRFHAENGRLERSVSGAAPQDHRTPPRVWRLGRDVAAMLSAQFAFPPFPAYHVRTNAFAIPTELMRNVAMPRLRKKAQAWRAESGKRSITAQLIGRDLDVRVVGRDGRSYDRTEWAESETFWQGEQANLLVADNQTEKYRLADLAGRTLLSGLAWGTSSRPSAPRS